MTDSPADHAHPTRRHGVRWVVLGIAGLLGVAILLAGFTPLLDDDLESRPAPAASYGQAMRLADQLRAPDGDDVLPECRSQVLDHGQRTARAVVLLHGFTNCPEQFATMARAYHQAGYNVVVVRLPEHGLSDRMTRAQSDLTPAALTAAADRGVDIAAGLGERVGVVGLSAGGTLAAWLAAERDDVTEAALLAPLMVPKVLPDVAVGPVARFSRLLPDFYLWWDGNLKRALSTPPYAYPRYSLRALGAILAVGRYAQGHVGRTTSLDRLLVVTNANDSAVSNAAVGRVGDVLAEHADAVVRYEFAADLGLRHDIVDPQGENAEMLPAIYATLGPLLGVPTLEDTLQ